MVEETESTKIRLTALNRLRRIAKATGLPMLEVLDVLIKREYERLKKKGVIEKGSKDD